MPTVSGVLMDVNITADALLEPRASSSITIKDPIVLSLRTFLNDADGFRNTWERLPHEIRTLGGLGRIFGFIMDAGQNDLRIVGQKDPKGNITIDSLILGLRAVWRDGLIPGCSLDPEPFDISGPQYTRVMAVPEDSLFARIMLDADYEMKRIMGHGAAKYGLTAYRSLSDIIGDAYRNNGKNNGVLARFWLYPKALSKANVWMTEDRKAVYFKSGIRVFTEEMVVTLGGMVGAGRQNKEYEAAARNFTGHMSDLEARVVDEKGRYPFRELHGLFDIVAFANLLRRMNVDLPVLRDFVGLPVLKLGPAEAAPPFYRGIQHSVPNTPIILCGGVEARTRVRSSVFGSPDISAPLPANPSLQTTASDGVAGVDDSKITIGRDQVEYERSINVENLFLKGCRYLSRGEYESAKSVFERILMVTPGDKDAYAYLALSEIGLDRLGEAEKAVEHSLNSDPRDRFFRTIALHLESARSNGGRPKRGADASVLMDLSNQYVREGESLMKLGLTKTALEKARSALVLHKGNARAHLVAASALGAMDRLDAARKHLLKARKVYRRRLRVHPDDSVAKRNLALALTRSVSILLKMNASYPDREPMTVGRAKEVSIYLERAIQGCEEAYELDPSNPATLLSSVFARLVKANIYNALGIGGSSDEALLKADLLVDRHPRLASAYGARAFVHLSRKNYTDAASDCRQALSISPLSGLGLIVKGKLLKQQNKCQEALYYLGKGARIEPQWRNFVAEDIRGCNGMR